MKISKIDENTIISQFLIKAESTHRSHESTGGSKTSIVIDWPAFRDTMIEWI